MTSEEPAHVVEPKSPGPGAAAGILLVVWLVLLGILIGELLFAARFRAIFDDMNVELPSLTSFVVGAADELASGNVVGWLVLVGPPLAAILVFARGARGKRFAAALGLAAFTCLVLVVIIPPAVFVPIFKLQKLVAENEQSAPVTSSTRR